MQAIIPVAGVGTRLRPLTTEMPKVLLNVAGKPMLGHLIEKLLEIGIKDYIFITGYLEEMIKEYVSTSYKNINAKYVHQEEMKGTAHAIGLAKPYIKEAVLIVFGDTLFKGSLKGILKNDSDGLVGVCQTNDPKRFGIIEAEGKKITRMVEKPDRPPSKLAIIGVYLINNHKLLFECIEHIIRKGIKTKGEYQLTDALQLMIKNNANLNYFEIKQWLDCGQVETVLETNKELLKKIGLRKNKKIGNSIVIAPSHIGENVILENSVIGPYAVIKDYCVIKDSTITNSIVDQSSVIEDSKIKNFLIGKHAMFKKEERNGNFIEAK